MLLLLDDGVEFETVYADHGADWPETRDYVAMLKEKGYPITSLQTRESGLPLYDFYLRYKRIPARFLRACTSIFKVRPLARYMIAPCVVYLGIDAGEAQRATQGRREGETRLYPLVEWGLDRSDCVKVIREHNLPVPIKSGCFVCPFQRRAQWRELLTKHPDLFRRARILEDATNERLRAKGGEPMYLAGIPLGVAAQEGQLDLFGERPVEVCLCEF